MGKPICQGLLAGSIQVAVDVSGGITMPHPFLNIFPTEAVIQKRTCAAMPLRHHYDKPEKLRISRGGSFMARCFILLQSKKSNRKIDRDAAIGISSSVMELPFLNHGEGRQRFALPPS